MRHLWWVLGLVLVGGGLALVLTSPTGQTDFGWFAYTPLDDDPDWFMELDGSRPSWTAYGVIMSRGQLVGAAVAGAGLLVLGSWAGYRLGKRARPAAE